MLQRELRSVWASRSALRNRRFGNYCENCAQEEVKPTEFPEEPLLPATQSSPSGQGLVVPDSLTQMQRLEPHSLKRLSHQMSNVSLLFLVASGWLILSPPNPAGTSWHKPPAGLRLETPLFYNPTPQAHNPLPST